MLWTFGTTIRIKIVIRDLDYNQFNSVVIHDIVKHGEFIREVPIVAKESKKTAKTDKENQEEVVEILDAKDEKVEETIDEANDESKSELEKIIQEKEELYDRYLRLQAEYNNFTKRTQRERVSERKYKSQDLVTELLPALDNFERALQIEVTPETKSFVEGITMVHNQINSALESEDVKEIESVGKEFDPNLHHAVIQEDDPDVESNIVLEELQKGYILHDRVIRAAMVKVSK